jgi:hypothetical protein
MHGRMICRIHSSSRVALGITNKLAGALDHLGLRQLIAPAPMVLAGMLLVPDACHNLAPSLAALQTPALRPILNAAALSIDPRLVRLRKFFGTRKCPVHAIAEQFLLASYHHQLDWRLLPSLSWVESGCGRAAANNNLFGWQSGAAEFASLEHGIHFVASRLALSSTYKGKSLEGILRTYNPVPGYVERVTSVMEELGPAILGLPSDGEQRAAAEEP